MHTKFFATLAVSILVNAGCAADTGPETGSDQSEIRGARPARPTRPTTGGADSCSNRIAGSASENNGPVCEYSAVGCSANGYKCEGGPHAGAACTSENAASPTHCQTVCNSCRP
jgi:hypothetical protein